ncbi:hypothetical protein L195_g052230, partial [Trifolium pratense]
SDLILPFSVVFESVVVIALSAHIAKEGKLNCTVNLWLKCRI